MTAERETLRLAELSQIFDNKLFAPVFDSGKQRLKASRVYCHASWANPSTHFTRESPLHIYEHTPLSVRSFIRSSSYAFCSWTWECFFCLTVDVNIVSAQHKIKISHFLLSSSSNIINLYDLFNCKLGFAARCCCSTWLDSTPRVDSQSHFIYSSIFRLTEEKEMKNLSDLIKFK